MSSVAYRRLATAGLVGLALLMVAWHAAIAPPKSVPVVLLLAVVLLPLTLAALSAISDGGRGLTIGGIGCLFYLAHGVMEAWAAPQVRWLALIEVVLAAGVLQALLMAAISGKRERRTANPPAKPVEPV